MGSVGQRRSAQGHPGALAEATVACVRRRVTFPRAASYLWNDVKMSACSAVLVAATLALSACGGSQNAISGGPRRIAVTLPAPLVQLLASEAGGTARSLGDPSVKTAQVYGPDSRYLLVKASSGDLVQRVARERKGFYLIVLHG